MYSELQRRGIIDDVCTIPADVENILYFSGTGIKKLELILLKQYNQFR